MSSISAVEAALLNSYLKEMFDCELVHHGFTNYMRDYEFVVYQSCDPNPKYGLSPRHLRFIFRLCPEATVTSRVRPDVWARSLDDSLLDEQRVTRESPGYVWGVQTQCLYPGASVIDGSDRARFWANALGVEFHEIVVEANAQSITLVFSDIQVDEVSDGYAPYQLHSEGVPEKHGNATKIPLSPKD
jgi:hypothetical protein